MLESVKTLKLDSTNLKLNENKNQKISFKSNSSNTLERTPEADKVEEKKGLSKGAKWAIGLSLAAIATATALYFTKGKSKPNLPKPETPKPKTPKPETSKPDLKDEIERRRKALEARKGQKCEGLEEMNRRAKEMIAENKRKAEEQLRLKTQAQEYVTRTLTLKPEVSADSIAKKALAATTVGALGSLPYLAQRCKEDAEEAKANRQPINAEYIDSKFSTDYGEDYKQLKTEYAKTEKQQRKEKILSRINTDGVIVSDPVYGELKLHKTPHCEYYEKDGEIVREVFDKSYIDDEMGEKILDVKTTLYNSSGEVETIVYKDSYMDSIRLQTQLVDDEGTVWDVEHIYPIKPYHANEPVTAIPDSIERYKSLFSGNYWRDYSVSTVTVLKNGNNGKVVIKDCEGKTHIFNCTFNDYGSLKEYYNTNYMPDFIDNYKFITNKVLAGKYCYTKENVLTASLDNLITEQDKEFLNGGAIAKYNSNNETYYIKEGSVFGNGGKPPSAACGATSRIESYVKSTPDMGWTKAGYTIKLSDGRGDFENVHIVYEGNGYDIDSNGRLLKKVRVKESKSNTNQSSQTRETENEEEIMKVYA